MNTQNTESPTVREPLKILIEGKEAPLDFEDEFPLYIRWAEAYGADWRNYYGGPFKQLQRQRISFKAARRNILAGWLMLFLCMLWALYLATTKGSPLVGSVFFTVFLTGIALWLLSKIETPPFKKCPYQKFSDDIHALQKAMIAFEPSWNKGRSTASLGEDALLNTYADDLLRELAKMVTPFFAAALAAEGLLTLEEKKDQQVWVDTWGKWNNLWEALIPFRLQMRPASTYMNQCVRAVATGRELEKDHIKWWD